MQMPSLEALLADYAVENARVPHALPLTPSPTTPAELARIAAELHIALPADYQTLALHYNLAAIEFNFSLFFPLDVGRLGQPRGLFDAFTVLLTSDEYPFTKEYKRWGVVPVGADNWNNVLVLAVRQATAPNAGEPHAPDRPLATTRPYGSIWAYYPDEMLPAMRYRFEYVSASFTQALHMALLCWSVGHDRRDTRGVNVREGDLRTALATIDPTTQSASYWHEWITLALESM